MHNNVSMTTSVMIIDHPYLVARLTIGGWSCLGLRDADDDDDVGEDVIIEGSDIGRDIGGGGEDPLLGTGRATLCGWRWGWRAWRACCILRRAQIISGGEVNTCLPEERGEDEAATCWGGYRGEAAAEAPAAAAGDEKGAEAWVCKGFYKALGLEIFFF